MKACLTVLPLVFALHVQGLLAVQVVAESEDGPIPKAKWKSAYTETAWGLKLKTVKYTYTKIKVPSLVKVVLEFTKDLKADELKAVKEAFDSKQENLEFCFFDEDGVIIAKLTSMNFAVQGDMTGMKGDAIRCVIGVGLPLLFSTDQGKKVSKVELRPPLPK